MAVLLEPSRRDIRRLALIGMSGIGKTFFTRQLSECGLLSISCDELIEGRLRARFPIDSGQGTRGIAAWLGWPSSETYAARESAYLEEEEAVIKEVLAFLESDPAAELILDTTGSVIYAEAGLLDRLRRELTVVYLSPAGDCEFLVNRYLCDPKPVIWRGVFQPLPGEADQETASRCFLELIESRHPRFERLSDVIIPVRPNQYSMQSVTNQIQRIWLGRGDP